jgi:hypothetical protein
VIAALSSLEGTPDFEAFVDWLEDSLADLMNDNCRTKDEVLVRWQQGACQVLNELVMKARSARQVQHSRKR